MIKGSTLENKTLELGHPERPLRFSSHSGLVKAVKNIISNIGKHGQLHPDFFYLPSICNYILTFRDLGLLQVLSRSTSDLDVLDSCDKDPFAIRVSKTGNVDMLSLVATTSMASSEDEYGCNILHWLFLFGQDASVAATEFATVAPELCSRFINKPSKTVFSVHPQWPLQLFGTPLSFAVAVGSEHAVRALLNVGADPNALAYLPGVYTDHRKNWTAMHIAVKYQDVSMLDILRQDKGDLSKPTLPPSPDFTFSNRKSRVFKRGCRISKPEAAEDGLSQSTTSTNCPLVKVFCKNRSVNKPKPAGATDSNPLESEPLACALSFSSPLERLALHGSKEIDAMTSIIHAIGPATELSKPTSDCSSPLELAISFNDSIGAAAILHVSPGLVLTRLPSKIPEDFGLFPIHVATEIASHRNSSDTLDMPELLHTFNPACLDQRDGNGLTCLHYAVRGVSSISAQWILEKRPKLLESEDLLGTTAIFHCTTSICLKFLLEKGANLHHQTPRKRTILHHMAANGSGHLLRDLCTKFSKMDAVDVDGHTVLHLAVMSGNREAVAVSLAQGANLDTHNKSGLTALHIAVRSGRHDLAELLLSYEADPWQESNEGQYPLHWTIEKEDIHTSKLLLKSTDGWKPDQGGNTPLHLAATQGNTKMMEFLVNCLTEGTRLDHLNASGASALHIAAFHGHIGSLNALIDAGADPLVTQRDGSNAMHVAIRGATQPAQRYTDRLEVYKRLVGPPYRSMLFRPDVTGSLPWDEAVRCLDLDAIYWILHSQSYSDGDTTACRDLKYLERLHLCLESQIFSLGAGKAQIKDASHRIFRQAAIYGDHRLLHMFLNSNFLTQDRMRIELNHYAGTYFNSRVQNLDRQESGLIYDGVIDTLSSRQLNFVRRSHFSHYSGRFIERPELRFSQIRGNA
jgi:ankyrin repeat protein